MANHNAGESLKLAMAEGRVRQCSAISKKTGQQCQRPAREGYAVCSMHGAGTKVREEKGIRRAPGRPIEHGLYSKNLTEDEQEAYQEAFGDLTLVHEAALSKVKLAKFIKKMTDRICDDAPECEEGDDGSIDIAGIAPRGKRKNAREDEFYYLKLLDACVKTVTAAYDQLREKKIVVNLKGTDEEVMEKVKAIVSSEMSFINELICPECKKKILEKMKDRQTTVMEK